MAASEVPAHNSLLLRHGAGDRGGRQGFRTEWQIGQALHFLSPPLTLFLFRISSSLRGPVPWHSGESVNLRWNLSSTANYEILGKPQFPHL